MRARGQRWRAQGAERERGGRPGGRAEAGVHLASALPLRFEGAPSGRFTATVCPPLTYLALRPMRCSVEHLMKGLGLREAHELSSS